MLAVVHIELSEANAFVSKHHRHHKPVTGHRFSIGAEKNGHLVGVRYSSGEDERKAKKVEEPY
jgi:hypothetical protein